MRRRSASAVLIVTALVAVALGCGGPPRPTLSPQGDRATWAPSPRSAIPMPAACPSRREPTPAELSFVSGRSLAIADEAISFLGDAIELARRERDLVWVVCVDADLTQLRATRDMIADHALASPDDDGAIALEVDVAHQLCERARELQIHARSCRGAGS